MKIRMVSTYPTTGEGVSRYTEFFIARLRKYRPSLEIATSKIFFLKDKLSSLAWINLAFDKSDILHLQYTPTGSGPLIIWFLLFRSKKKKFIITSHETPSTYSKHLPKFLAPIYNAFEKLVYGCADSIIVHTREHQMEIAQLGIKPDRVRIIPMPLFGPDQLPDNSKRDPQKGIFFGKIASKKGIEFLLRALQLLPKTVSVDIIGAADTGAKEYEAMLKQLVEKLGIGERVRFQGFLDDATVSERMSVAGFAVFPYKYVTQSAALTTAIGNGLVYIASDLPAFREFNEEFGGGLLFKAEQPNELAKAILALLKKEQYHKCQDEIRKAHNQLNWDRYVEIVYGIYENTR